MPPEAYILDIDADPHNSGVLYLGSSAAGVYYSTDSGASWNSLNDGLTNRTVVRVHLAQEGSMLDALTEGGGVFRLGTAQAD
ncbi:MAG: hypothetical protein HN348_27700 [Proteobacteria bacterium]|nr:hypothetical protein [Pseudomonadota bacterium]